MSEPGPGVRWRLAGLALLLLALIGLAMAWSWSPLRGWLDVDKIVALLQTLGRTYGPVAAMGAFALASTLAVPLTFLTVVTLIAFGPVAGCLCVVVGALLGAAASYGVGRFLGHQAMQRLAGEKANALSQRLARRGLWAVVAVRIVPVAPFAIINMVAGASHIRLRDMVLGTAIGMAPGTLIMAFFIGQIVDALKNPGVLTVGIVVLTLGLVVGGGWLFRRWLGRQEGV